MIDSPKTPKKKPPFIKVYDKGTYFIFTLVTTMDDGKQRYTSFSKGAYDAGNFFTHKSNLKYLKIPLMFSKDNIKYKNWKKKVIAEEVINNE